MLIFYLLSFLNLSNLQENALVYGQADPDSLITEKAYLHTDRDIYSPGDDIWFSAYLIDGMSMQPTDHSYNLHVELISPDLKIADSRTIKLTGGLGKGDFHLKEGLASGNYILRCYTNYMRNFGEKVFFRKMIGIISTGDVEKAFSGKRAGNNSLFASFFPEGGSLVADVSSVIAFKAEDDSGSPVKAQGRIFSSDGEFRGSFETERKGMGYIYFTPETGQKYYALIRTPDGSETRTQFPESFRKGVVLNISGNRNGLLDIYTRTNPPTLRLISEDDLHLSVFSRGVMFKTVSFRMNSLNGHLVISTTDIPDGVAALRLTGPSDVPLCERLVFIENNPSPEVQINTDKNTYGTRDSVSVRISVRDSNLVTSAAYLSFSAAEESSVRNTAFPSTIASWFLLESEVRGPVAEPGYYFDHSIPQRLKDLDLLLLTQGWRDFKWKYDEMKYPPEYGFTVSGSVRKKFANQPLDGIMANIGVFSGDKPFIRLVPIDSTGRFSLERLDFTGRTKIVASITDFKGNYKGLLKVDSLQYAPESVGLFINQFQAFMEQEQDSVSDKSLQNNISSFINSVDYRVSLQKKYKLSDTITPGEVYIKSIRRDAPESAKARSRRYLMATPDKEIVITPLLETYPSTFALISQRVITPFVSSPSPNLISNPIYMIDGAFVSKADVEALPLKWVERIDVLSNENSYTQFKYKMLGPSIPKGSINDFSASSPHKWDRVIFQDKDNSEGQKDGVISIILKSDAEIERVSPSYSVNLEMKGYDVPRVFYSPRHSASLQTDYKPDLRTTLFWKPDISIAIDSVAVLKYLNADNASKINITVEGMTSNGIPLTGRAEYIVK